MVRTMPKCGPCLLQIHATYCLQHLGGVDLASLLRVVDRFRLQLATDLFHNRDCGRRSWGSCVSCEGHNFALSPNKEQWPGAGAHACNPSYSGGRDQEDMVGS
jgi:hypothetical protein